MSGNILKSVNHLYFTSKVVFKLWYMTYTWVGRLFLHCVRGEKYFEQIGLMDINCLKTPCGWL